MTFGTTCWKGIKLAKTIQDDEGQLKDGRYVYTYRDNLNKQKKAYFWTLLPSDRIPKGKKKDKCFREKLTA